ncbi:MULTISPECIES: Asp-tRNA(Asn)/Glu-tRNA(Gln) amidotransferase subunit GatB [Candidatus Nitrosocaldus]|jgi:aspartyl-tRNA(Asn)/glutamyl-tRNA(Gln) amidotransferase subunit B|uniref:Aspartyl/glutamyl-tRNA(Asn/Gln) amidotransferase subunit B n=1 Tax=Candidatus Nitrosocaldus cavascurensis TaxID=2058097 RepID=A0A2K5AQK2_9ARCH|nr:MULTISPECIES: Asp-tRNA(Asn)/Glu-tRNA(Gln) amidotransferase subunit GatB [Candidatus Nitrosocaldus]SPC33931.1 Aspartyl/glutamyl-tRNA(Asn/Gln) amidotransferase subunit B [Candidatus Nitrosocaldus cavascurensis]
MTQSADKVMIGLEIHCQLTALKSKLFCPCPADYRGKEPNVNVCPICLGMPGTLPLLNRRAVEYAVMLAFALNCKIASRIAFYRKNYFYPDLPKNFQITQYNAYEQASVGADGYMELDDPSSSDGIGKVIRIRRIQLEEDPGRLVYDGSIGTSNYALVDYNRAGVALVEIVTEPDFNAPNEVRLFLNRLASILEHLGICNPALDGAVRCDANVSIGGHARVEIKNINSFRDVERAIAFEIARQRSLTARGIEVRSETRHWDDARRITVQARVKEEEEDYRYFPEPDIPSMVLSSSDLDAIRAGMPELPHARIERFVRVYALARDTAKILVGEKYIADLFEESIKYYGNARSIANWIVTDLKGYLERYGGSNSSNDGSNNNNSSRKSSDGSDNSSNVNYAGILTRITPKHIAELAVLVDSGKINRTMAKQIMQKMISTGMLPSTIIQGMDDVDMLSNRDELAGIVDRVMEEERKAVMDAISNEKTLNYLLGKVMKYSKGRADPKLVLSILKERIVNLRSNQ